MEKKSLLENLSSGEIEKLLGGTAEVLSSTTERSTAGDGALIGKCCISEGGGGNKDNGDVSKPKG